jgi:virulence factor Mce-like protein
VKRLLVLVALGLLGTSCSMLPGGGGDRYTITVYFPRAVALYEQSNVRVLGLPAGTVSDIEAVGDRVRVELSMRENVPVPVDVQAALVPQSLIGERYVELTPAWLDGDERLSDLPEAERVIDVEDTIVPVEPDDALAAANEFLQSLNPDGLGRLIDNVSATLEGNGAALNRAIGSIATLVDTFASRDDQLAAIVDNLDVLTSTLAGREAQIGQVLDAFAQATGVLASERESLERFLNAVANISEVGAELVVDNADQLREDLATLGRLSQSLVANLDSVERLIDSAPLLVSGTDGAFDPELRANTLRTHFGPLVTELLFAINPLLDGILPTICVPVDVACPDGIIAFDSEQSAAVAADVPGATPIDSIVALLAAPTGPRQDGGGRSTAEQVGDGIGSVGGWLRGAAETLAGAG